MTRFARAALVAVCTLAGSLCQPRPTTAQTFDLPQLQTVRAQPRAGIVSSIELTLSDVIERVLANDPELEISRIALDESGYRLEGALGYYDPTVSLDGYRSRSVSPIASVIGGSDSGKINATEFTVKPAISGSSPWFGSTYRLSVSDSRQTSDSTFNTLNPQFPVSATLEIRQPLWRGLRFDAGRHSVQVARKNRQLSEEQLRQRVIERITLAVQYYWELAYARQNLQVQTEAVQLSVEQYESNRRQAEQGILAPVSVVEAQTQVATYQQSEAMARQAMTVAENNLKQLMSSDRGDPVWTAALLPQTRLDPNVTVPSLEEALRQALAARPELSSSAIELAVNQLDSQLYRGESKPKVDAYATLTASGLAGTPQSVSPIFGNAVLGTVPAILTGSNSQALSSIWGRDFPTVLVGVQVSLPLRNRTAAANLAVSRADGRRLQALRRELEMSVEADVRNALEQVNASRTRCEAALVARRSAEEQYASERRQLAAGTSTVFLVFQRQTSFISARSSEERAMADLGSAVANLDRATARTVEAHRIRLNP
jgi:outer membrane protein TolC